MSLWIKITNDGQIDTKALHLLGVTNKRSDNSKIGFFGSGNKYALALLLREEIPFRIFSGLEEVKISTSPIEFRGENFDQIFVNGEPTSLTTSMGPDWEHWFAIREIYCNALDEGGATFDVSLQVEPEKDKTSIFILKTEKLSDFIDNLDKFILTEQNEPLFSVKTSYGDVRVFPPTTGQFICYRKGIRIIPENKCNASFRYDFSDVSINESRTYKNDYEIFERIFSAWSVCENEDIVLEILRNFNKSYHECVTGQYCWRYVQDVFSSAWHKLLSKKRVFPASIAKISGDSALKTQNCFIVPDELALKIFHEIPDCHVVGHSKGHKYNKVKPNKEQKEIVNQSLEELKNIGFDIRQKIIYVVPLVEDVMGTYDKTEDAIILSVKYLTDIKTVKNTILEEYFHSLGQADDRNFVTFLIDELIHAKEGAW